ncbi:MAG: hypothetical protein ACYDAJ_12085 [Nitrosotalea sp.]
MSRPFLHLNISLEEFKEEVVRGILDEMLEENGKEIKEIGLDYIRNEIEYDVTESIKGDLKIHRKRENNTDKKTEPFLSQMKPNGSIIQSKKQSWRKDG